MNIVLTIGNNECNYYIAIDYFQNIILQLSKHTDLIKNIGDPYLGKKGLVLINEFGKENIEKNVEKNVKSYLSNKSDINSSTIGYSLSIIGVTPDGFKFGVLVSYGVPKISGRDTVNINFSHEMFTNKHQDFNEKMNLILKLFCNLITVLKPRKAIVKDYLVSKENNINDMLVGYYIYMTGEVSGNLKLDNLEIKSKQFEEGLLIEFKIEDRNFMIDKIRKFYEINKNHFKLYNNFGERA